MLQLKIHLKNQLALGKGYMCCIPLILTTSLPWIRQMSPQFRDVSDNPVAPSEGKWARSIAATCVTQHSSPWLFSSQSCRGHWGQCLLKDSSHGMHGRCPTTRKFRPKRKEPACAAWALWCSSSCPGTSEALLQPPELFVGWPSEGWSSGSRSHGEEGLHGSQLTLQLSTWWLFTKSSYQMWILFGIGFWLCSYLASQLQFRSSVNLKFT